ncbi:MAG: hypothetical protein GY821_07730 [Gammaproteobacteria bacterium]|nr:hypothetical protein [Gammaproteobacteria bacterium]
MEISPHAKNCHLLCSFKSLCLLAKNVFFKGRHFYEHGVIAFRGICLISLGAPSVSEDEKTFLKARRRTFFECYYEHNIVALAAFPGSCLM